MRKLFFILSIIFSVFCAGAQEDVTAISLPPQSNDGHRVYAELLGAATNLLGFNKNVAVSVDLGQYQSFFKQYHILDENGEFIKFNSMVQAMNYMGERGWKFVQAYIVTENKQNVYHWLMYKDISDYSQVYEGLHIKNTDSEPKKEKKEKKKEKKASKFDDLYGE